jgi:outer membrane protein assembly factor BamB
LILASRNGNLSILGEETDDFSLPPLSGIPLQAVSRNENIAFTLRNNQMVLLSVSEALKGSSQSILWTAETQNIAASTTKTLNMKYDERGIYLVSQNGASGFTEDGRRLWIINILGSSSMPSFSDEGLLYSGGTDWILYAYRLEERILGMKQSVYGPEPEGNYGLGNPGPSAWSDYYFRNDESELRRELNYIEEMIFSGKTGTNEKEFIAYLMEVSSNEIANAGRRNPSAVHAAQRIRALQLLSYIGSREIIPFLVHIFDHDSEPMVQAAAAEAIGKIGVDPEGIALKAFSTKIYSTATQKNEQVLNAAAISAASLCRFSGPPLSDDGIRFLLLLASSTMPRSVQNQAKRELDTLR